MAHPALSTAALAQMLRTLADRVDSGADVFEVSMETENIGHATKTTIVLWGLPKPTPEEAELHRRRVQPWRDGTLPAVSQVCGECPSDQPHTCGVYRAAREALAPKRSAWCQARIAGFYGTVKTCSTFLNTDGTCPNADRHQ